MASQRALSLKLAMEEPGYKEYGTFLAIPAFATLACGLIPIFHCEQGLSSIGIVPLMGAFSYGHAFAPRKAYYEKSLHKLMNYPSFILGSVKKTLLFAIPTGLAGWVTSLFLNGYPKELAKIFEIATWGLMSGICLYALMAYADETYKHRNVNKVGDKAKMVNLWKWIVPPAVASSLLVIFKGYLLFEIIKGRPG